MESFWICLPMLVLLTYWHSFWLFKIPVLLADFPFLGAAIIENYQLSLQYWIFISNSSITKPVFVKSYTYYLIKSTTHVIMDKHWERLATLCRLCRLKTKTNKRYYTPKCIQDYRMKILEIFNYDFGNDSVNIHLSHVCDPCRRENWSITKKAIKRHWS